MKTRILSRCRAALCAASFAAGVSLPALAPVHAQGLASSFDRTVVPAPGPTPALVVPTWATATLANGAELIVAERRSLPLVSVRIDFVGGANHFEPADRTGLASFVASMLSEGTTTRTGDELSAALQLLGTDINAFIGGESGSISFIAMTDQVEPVLEILGDMLLNPAFPDEALERLRARTLVGLRQARDRTGAIAGYVFPKVLYTLDHPYGRYAREETINAITRDDIVRFQTDYYQPGRAIITVAGDVSPADARRMIEHALAEWSPGGGPPDFAYPAVPEPAGTRIYLVDKPGAVQSSFALGLVGPPRSTPDYYALRVMNSLFGEQFQGRLNNNIREQKGYSYGVRSSFSYGRGPGPFRAGGDIIAAKTDSALVEFLHEIRGIRGDRAVTDDEMEAAKAALVQSLPERFASVAGVAQAVSSLYVEGLPEDYYHEFVRRINAVTSEDVVRVARRYIDPEHLAIIIVGDRATIEEPLRALDVAPIIVLDVDGDPIT